MPDELEDEELEDEELELLELDELIEGSAPEALLEELELDELLEVVEILSSGASVLLQPRKKTNKIRLNDGMESRAI